MRILVLGGTEFIGRTIVEQALGRRHTVTLFSRGRSGRELFGQAERRIGDRATGDYAALADGSWDAVIDVSGYIPRHVGQAADALGERVGRYLFISTGSVYDMSRAAAGMDETAARLAAERGTEDVTDSTYGPLKVACEDDLTARYGERLTLVRPGIVAGPYDPTDRFTWWVRRAARGGRVALPADPDQPVQVLDSRDLAHLVLVLIEADRAGTFNAVGPAEPTTLAGLIGQCAQAAGTSVEVVPVPAGEPGFPLVLADRSRWGGFQRSAARARAAGLPATPLAVTARDVLAWDRGRGEPPLAVGLSPDREAALLATAGS